MILVFMVRASVNFSSLFSNLYPCLNWKSLSLTCLQSQAFSGYSTLFVRVYMIWFLPACCMSLNRPCFPSLCTTFQYLHYILQLYYLTLAHNQFCQPYFKNYDMIFHSIFPKVCQADPRNLQNQMHVKYNFDYKRDLQDFSIHSNIFVILVF